MRREPNGITHFPRLKIPDREPSRFTRAYLRLRSQLFRAGIKLKIRAVQTGPVGGALFRRDCTISKTRSCSGEYLRLPQGIKSIVFAQSRLRLGKLVA